MEFLIESYEFNDKKKFLQYFFRSDTFCNWIRFGVGYLLWLDTFCGWIPFVGIHFVRIHFVRIHFLVDTLC